MTHLFHVPHADDETLSLGVAILQCLDRGEEVHLILITDGSACGSFHFLNGTEKCPIHHRFHDPVSEGYQTAPLTREAHIAARQREFLAAGEMLGVPRENLHVHTMIDGSLTVEEARAIALQYEQDASIPGPKVHHTMTERHDNHNDHKSCGRALAELLEEGQISACHWYVKRSLWHTVPADAPVQDLVASVSQADILRSITRDVYQRWEPENGHYAVGYHSVPESFDAMMDDCRNKVHHTP
ncbi:MAG: PIG-L family deacetylase [Candidatus Sumerlaeia bacterium]|nr:PIG-L family deacetylase [Candidatus Sumerlaeia bacterium]